MPKLGTIEWANATHGSLTNTEKLTLLRQAIELQLTRQWKRITNKEVIQPARVNLDRIVIPDTHIAIASLETCQAVAPPSIINHSLRTYFWGHILAMQNGLTVDAETFYVMSLWHDLGLCNEYHHKDGVSKCFAVAGGRAAGEFVKLHSTSAQAQEVEAAIIRHINLIVPPEDGILNHLLHAATMLDVVGTRIDELHPDTITAVLEHYPRLSFKEDLIRLFRREYERRPDSRIAFMQQIGNLNRRIQRAPFDS